jgi:hypothetical protein
MLFYQLTYLFTPWSIVLLEKPAGPHLVKKIPAFYGTQKFITALYNSPLLLHILSKITEVHAPHPTS